MWVFICGGLLSYPALSAAMSGRQELDLSGPGWQLWYDRQAAWAQDELYFPTPDLAKLPVNAPTGGWAVLHSAQAKEAAVPGTVEEYLQTVAGPEGDLTGVSWWYRDVRIPAAARPRHIFLRFESARQRAEVYVNEKLVGYDLVGNTPFEVNLTDVARPGETIRLAVRITDPGGNFDWRDGTTIPWGRFQLPGSHGFGGITGRVKLVACDPIYVNELYIQNTPARTEVNAEINIHNDNATEAKRDLDVSVSERRTPAAVVFHKQLTGISLKPGDNTIPLQVSAPTAQLWDVEHPNLYVFKVAVKKGKQATDTDQQTFGFRWFEPVGIGTDAMFRLNGRRIVLRTAISWGFWPVNGIFPTPALAERQIRVAKELGLNMLNFHRAIGQPIVLEKADELGLLYFEEPGNYRSGGSDKFAQALAREKLLRMVRRDRNHPSLVIYNMINESAGVPEAILQIYEHDLRAAHAIDPSRVMTRTSAWAKGKDVADPIKMHMRPFDDKVYFNGWYDFHHAGGPAVWDQIFYRKPKDYYNYTDNNGEIVFWGEEGAISTPPRLEKMKAALTAAPSTGWDGRVYLDWYKAFDEFLTRKDLRSAFPTVDALTTALGVVSFEHQGRKIENMRLSNVADGYAINGWEAEIIENHSGVVDSFRNPKADPAIISYYNQPLYVAVKLRSQITQLPGRVRADFYAINEQNLRGAHTLRILTIDPTGQEIFRKDVAVSLTGGDVYGQLLAADVEIPIAGAPGKFRVEATLLNPAGRAEARGHDEILAVDWQSAKLSGKGAVWEGGSQVRSFLKEQKGVAAPAYTDGLARLDWVVIAQPPNVADMRLIAPEQLRDPAGQTTGLRATFFTGPDFKQQVFQRTDSTVNLTISEGATPDLAVPTTESYSIRWDGQLSPAVTGQHTFALQTTGSARVSINGHTIIEVAETRGGIEKRGQIDLVAGQSVPLKIEFSQQRGAGHCKLMWALPATDAPDPQRLLERARRDGTTLLIMDYAEPWMDFLRTHAGVKYSGAFKVGTNWLGGVHFVRQHPLFKELPVNSAMSWPYQAVVRNGNDRVGLMLADEELVVGAYHSYPMQLGTAVGVIPFGPGRIVVSTLDIIDNLAAETGPAAVARKLLCNYIEYARPR
ncbi:MAG: PA14 domain-containing protein [Pyrinomonadaceae bacterium]